MMGNSLFQRSRPSTAALPRWLLVVLIAAASVLCSTGWGAASEEAETRFEEANRLFERGDFAGAATAYERVIAAGQVSVPLLFNAGNALFKAGEFGQAIYYFRQAERSSPRDPDVRANLQFARKEIAGAFAPAKSGWKRFFHVFAESEWALLAAFLSAVWFLLLALREALPRLRGQLQIPTRIAAIVAILSGITCGFSHAAWSVADDGVIVAERVNARYGPLADSKAAFVLKDGEEVKLTGEKGDWIQVHDSTGRSGWVQRGDLKRIDAPIAPSAPSAPVAGAEPAGPAVEVAE
jgi:tetratricopeptide (TPR) repeat protein